MRRAGTAAVVLAIAAAAMPARAAPKVYLAVPQVPWETLVPYVRANVVPIFDGSGLRVFVCKDVTDRTAVVPFDDALSDFTKALVIEAVMRDRKIEAAIRNETERWRPIDPLLTAREQTDAKNRFWEELAASPDFLPRLRTQFAAVGRDGRLRCRTCEHEASFAPAAPKAGS